MRRGTPSAELFGWLLSTVRIAGTRRSMREVGDSIGAPAATVSQVEKGQRALKEPKIAVWAAALDVSEDDLHELWFLSQGLIRVGRNRAVFYSEWAGEGPLRDGLVPSLPNGPDLEPIYRLAERIAIVMRRLIPEASIDVTEDKFDLYIDEIYTGTLTAAQQDENETAKDFLPVPIIEFVWPVTLDRPSSGEKWDAVRVPLLQRLAPIMRRRSRTVKVVELEDLIRELSGSERERLRGYIEAIVEQRA